LADEIFREGRDVEHRLDLDADSERTSSAREKSRDGSNVRKSG